MRGKAALLGPLLAACLALAPGARAQEQGFMAIGTGSLGGVYHAAGDAICAAVNRTRDRHGLRCAVQATPGSVANLESLGRGTLEFAVAQSDIGAAAQRGEAPFESGAVPGLRTVFTLHEEMFTLLARADSGIETLADLRGRRVNLGNAGSGQRATVARVFAALGIGTGEVAAADGAGRRMIAQICAGEVDALVQTIGHPTALIREATEACDLRLVPVAGPEIDGLLAELPAYRKAVIPGGLYRGNDGAVETFSVTAALFATETVPDGMAAAVAEAVLGDVAAMRKAHPAFAVLDADGMVPDAPPTPFHDGARAAYSSMGLID